MTGTPTLSCHDGQESTTSSLTQSLARVNSLRPRIRTFRGFRREGRLANLPAEPGQPWLLCHDVLTQSQHFETWRAALADWMRSEHGGTPERTIAGHLMSWYLQVPGYLAGALFHTARRVPSLHPRDLAFRLGPQRPHPDAVAVLEPGFACLPNDPAAATPEATVVADEHALAALMRARFVAHAAQFVTAFGPTTRFGRRMLWAAATDALDRGLWMAGRMGGDEGAGVADAALVLPDRLAPFTSGSTLRPISDPDGATRWTRRRESCCFHYALPDVQRPCSTCPRIDDAERAARAAGRQ